MLLFIKNLSEGNYAPRSYGVLDGYFSHRNFFVTSTA